MDMLDRLGRLLRSIVPEEALYNEYDPDLSTAWAELDAYLEEEEVETHRQFHRPGSPVDEAYRVLELDRDASMEQVRESYKRLLRKYHPDRFAGRPEKQRAATEVTQAVIAAYRMIKRSQES